MGIEPNIHTFLDINMAKMVCSIILNYLLLPSSLGLRQPNMCSTLQPPSETNINKKKRVKKNNKWIKAKIQRKDCSGSITYMFFSTCIYYFQVAFFTKSPDLYCAVQRRRQQIIIATDKSRHYISMPTQCLNTLKSFIVPNLARSVIKGTVKQQK